MDKTFPTGDNKRSETWTSSCESLSRTCTYLDPYQMDIAMDMDIIPDTDKDFAMDTERDKGTKREKDTERDMDTNR